jgi:hypothetical protein
MKNPEVHWLKAVLHQFYRFATTILCHYEVSSTAITLNYKK